MVAHDAPQAKRDEAFRTIGEAAEMLGVEPHVLRFWEGKFKQLKPVKRRGGRRYYRPEDIEYLKLIQQLLYKEGFTIKGAVRHVAKYGTKTAMPDASPALPDPAVTTTPELSQLLEELRQMRRLLDEIS